MIKLIFSPDTTGLETFFEKGKFTLAWRLCVILSIVFVLLTVIFIDSDIQGVLTYGGCMLLTVCSLIYLRLTKKFKFVYFFLAFMGTIIASYTLNNLNSLVHFGDFLWIVLLIILSFFGLEKKIGFLFLFLNLLSVIYFCLFSVNNNIAEVNILDLSGRIALTVEMCTAIGSIGYIIYQFVIFHNYSYDGILEANSGLKKQNEIILSQNKEKTILIKEIHHRVKNNLQIIVSLLRLHKNEIESEVTKLHFSDAINRIMVMSLIHEKLYQDERLAEIKLGDYLRELTSDILKLSTIEKPVDINIDTRINRMGLKTIVPLGLIINELVLNSLEHAFSKTENAKIKILLSELPDNYIELKYWDNGIWSKKEEGYSSFGLELMEILSSQLEGKIDRKIDSNGTAYEFKLKNLD